MGVGAEMQRSGFQVAHTKRAVYVKDMGHQLVRNTHAMLKSLNEQLLI
jgi:hypothetical protein